MKSESYKCDICEADNLTSDKVTGFNGSAETDSPMKTARHICNFCRHRLTEVTKAELYFPDVDDPLGLIHVREKLKKAETRLVLAAALIALQYDAARLGRAVSAMDTADAFKATGRDRIKEEAERLWKFGRALLGMS